MSNTIKLPVHNQTMTLAWDNKLFKMLMPTEEGCVLFYDGVQIPVQLVASEVQTLIDCVTSVSKDITVMETRLANTTPHGVCFSESEGSAFKFNEHGERVLVETKTFYEVTWNCTHRLANNFNMELRVAISQYDNNEFTNTSTLSGYFDVSLDVLESGEHNISKLALSRMYDVVSCNKTDHEVAVVSCVEFFRMTGGVVLTDIALKGLKPLSGTALSRSMKKFTDLEYEQLLISVQHKNALQIQKLKADSDKIVAHINAESRLTAASCVASGMVASANIQAKASYDASYVIGGSISNGANTQAEATISSGNSISQSINGLTKSVSYLSE